MTKTRSKCTGDCNPLTYGTKVSIYECVYVLTNFFYVGDRAPYKPSMP